MYRPIKLSPMPKGGRTRKYGEKYGTAESLPFQNE